MEIPLESVPSLKVGYFSVQIPDTLPLSLEQATSVALRRAAAAITMPARNDTARLT
jgi:hypothetical protein